MSSKVPEYGCCVIYHHLDIGLLYTMPRRKPPPSTHFLILFKRILVHRELGFLLCVVWFAVAIKESLFPNACRFCKLQNDLSIALLTFAIIQPASWDAFIWQCLDQVSNHKIVATVLRQVKPVLIMFFLFCTYVLVLLFSL